MSKEDEAWLAERNRPFVSSWLPPVPSYSQEGYNPKNYIKKKVFISPQLNDDEIEETPVENEDKKEIGNEVKKFYFDVVSNPSELSSNRPPPPPNSSVNQDNPIQTVQLDSKTENEQKEGVFAILVKSGLISQFLCKITFEVYLILSVNRQNLPNFTSFKSQTKDIKCSSK